VTEEAALLSEKKVNRFTGLMHGMVCLFYGIFMAYEGKKLIIIFIASKNCRYGFHRLAI